MALALLSWGGITAACEPAQAPPSATTQDSAGIRILTNGPEMAGPPPVGTTVDLRIGGPGTSSGPEFGFVADVEVDQAGRLHVLDQQAAVVRVFDGTGENIATLGGPGEGPGELSRFTSSVWVRGDSVYVADWAQARVTFFPAPPHREAESGGDADTNPFAHSADDDGVDSWPIPGDAGPRTWWVRSGDDFWFRRLTRVTRDDGRWGGEDLLLRLGPDRETADSILPLDYAQTDLGGRGNVLVPIVVNTPMWAILSDGRIVWTTLDSDELRVHGPDGSLQSIIRSGNWTRRAATSADEDGFTELLRQRMTVLGGSADMVDQLPVVQPDRLPAITAVVAGTDGDVWVQRMGDVDAVHPMAINTPDTPTSWGGRIWDVVDAGGNVVRTVQVPPRFRLTRVGRDVLYGVLRNELDVDAVVRLRVDGL